MTANLLSKIPLFSNLPIAELNHLQNTLQIKHLQPDEILFHFRETGEHFYAVLKGELQVLLGEGTKEEMLLNTLGPGDYLGEMSLITSGGTRTASARATKKSTLLTISREEFAMLLERYPKLAHGMIRVLSERLDATNGATFRNLTEKNRQLQKAYDDLKTAQKELVEKERLERELQVAADIQLSILPELLPVAPHFDFGACIDPARQVGGDFYDIFHIDENTVAVLIGDVADKGVPSAIFMARAHALIAAEAENYEDPGDVMRKVNQHIMRLEKNTLFVTVFYGILDIDSGELRYARAGHEPPLMLMPDGTVERLPYKTGMALGAWDDIILDEETITLPPGSTLLLYTDGMTDCRNPEGEQFGLEGIKDLLAGYVDLSAQKVCDQMLQTLKDYQQGAKQDDDVTLVAVHAK